MIALVIFGVIVWTLIVLTFGEHVGRNCAAKAHVDGETWFKLLVIKYECKNIKKREPK